MTSLIPTSTPCTVKHPARRLPTALAAVVVMTALVGGCAGGGRDQVSSAGAAPRPGPQRSGTTPSMLNIRMTPADLDTRKAIEPGKRLVGKQIYRGKLPHGDSASPLAIGAGGDVLVVINPEVRTGTELPIIGQSTLEWWHGGRRRVASDGKTTRVGPASQAFQASACGTPPVWLETHSVTLDRQDWRIWTRLPGQTRPTSLGSSAKMLPGPDPAPARGLATPVSNGKVAYWPIMRGVKGKNQTAIAGRSLVGSMRPRVYAVNGILPQVRANGDLLFLRRHDEDPQVPVDEVQVRKVSRGTETLVRTIKIRPKTEANSFAAHGNRLAIAVHDTTPFDPKGTLDSTLLAWTEPALNTASGSRTPSGSATEVIRVHQHGNGPALAFAGDYLVWGNGSGSGDGGQYILDIALRQVYRLSSNPGLSYVYTCGSNLAWTTVGKGNAMGDFVAANWR